MIIRNGKIFLPEGRFKTGDLLIADGIITSDPAAASADGILIDAAQKYIIPGLVDIHSHGAVGHDFCDADPDGLREILRYEKSCGITAYGPTAMTLSKEMLTDIFQSAAEIRPDPDLADIAGINMEGPFISEAKKGAQNSAYISVPDADMVEELNRSCGSRIRLVTLAPETEGSDAFIRRLKDKITISVGHTNASCEEASRAFEAGADHVTHLCNAMPPFHHRNPGVIGAAADHRDVFVEVICDGIHLHPSMVRSIFRLFGSDRVCLISDSMEAAGMPDGDYELGRQHVIKKGPLATLEDGTLAGSVTNLFDCMRKAISFGIRPEDAIRAATANPAASIGLYPDIGSLAPGAKANVLILDREFQLLQVIKDA
jgi:N-acetylglucosamine-6-phosphate deacetylase